MTQHRSMVDKLHDITLQLWYVQNTMSEKVLFC